MNESDIVIVIVIVSRPPVKTTIAIHSSVSCIT